MGGYVTFHRATVATLDACGKLPLRVLFDARRASSAIVDGVCVHEREWESCDGWMRGRSRKKSKNVT